MPVIKQYGFFLPVLLFYSLSFFSQKRLEITYTRLGRLKEFELYVGDYMQYKSKGERHFRENRIACLQDSIIIFDNDSAITLNELVCLRFKKPFFYEKGLHRILLTGALLWPLITTVSNYRYDNPPYLREGAVIVSASLVAVYFIARRLQIKRIRITKNKTLKILDPSYRHLSQK